jgi:hypothetical protein
MKIVRRGAAAVVVLAIAGCAAPIQRPGPVSRHDDYVLVQACMPDRQATGTETAVDVTDLPENLPQRDWEDLLLRVKVTKSFARTTAEPRILATVRQFRPGEGDHAAPAYLSIGDVMVRNGVGSSAGSGGSLADSTERGQPVYAASANGRPGELLAVSTMRTMAFAGRDQPVQMWYVPPPEIPRGRWTAWMEPVHMSPLHVTYVKDSPMHLLFAGKPMPRSAVPADAPRVRFMAMPNRDRFTGSAGLVRARRMQALGGEAGFDPAVGPPRPVVSTIPAC